MNFSLKNLPAFVCMLASPYDSIENSVNFFFIHEQTHPSIIYWFAKIILKCRYERLTNWKLCKWTRIKWTRFASFDWCWTILMSSLFQLPQSKNILLWFLSLHIEYASLQFQIMKNKSKLLKFFSPEYWTMAMTRKKDVWMLQMYWVNAWWLKPMSECETNF